MSKNIENFNENFSYEDILLEYENTNKEQIKTILEKLDNLTLRRNISVEFIYSYNHCLESILVYINDTGETICIDNKDIEKLEEIKKDLDKYYGIYSSKLTLSTASIETHFNPNNKEILIGLKEQLIDFVILNKHINTDNILTSKQAINHLSLLLYHEYYHYLFDELKIGDSNLTYRDLLSRDEIYLKIINKYRNEKLAWKFASEWSSVDIDKRALNAFIETSMFSYSSYCKKALEEVNNPYSYFVNVMGVTIIIKD